MQCDIWEALPVTSHAAWVPCTNLLRNCIYIYVYICIYMYMHICIYKYICRDGSGSSGVLHTHMLRYNFHTAPHCITLKHPATATIDASRSAGELCTELKTLQHTATRCNALQILHHTASHCNTATGIMEWL